MMLARVRSCAVIGLEGLLVDVEVDIAPGLPSFTVVGLGDTAVQESRERVRAAIRNSGLHFPMRRLTAGLAPADLRKAGPAYDLPIAVGVLLATEQLNADLSDAVLIGELALDGQLRHADGVLPMVAVARNCGIQKVYLPVEDAAEAALVGGLTVIPVPSLSALVDHLCGIRRLTPYLGHPNFAPAEPVYNVDFQHVRGQEHARRALEVAAAGSHNILMSGSPGAGKTLMARALVSILPPMTLDEALEVTKIYSVAGQLPKDTPLIRQRPFQAPHHSTSLPGLVGGGSSRVRPGVVSLAHRGVLFLDELPEFGAKLEALRQPLEDKLLTLSRAAGSLTYPAAVMLVAAQNPCPCGYLGDPERECSCTPALVTRYQKRISGPLLDRIDIHVEVPRVNYEKLSSDRLSEPSAAIRARVVAARERQLQRARARYGDWNPEQINPLAGPPRCLYNAELGPAEIREECRLDSAGQSLLKAAVRQLALSARGYHRVLKLARTIADLAGVEQIAAAHVAEALQYRPRRSE